MADSSGPELDRGRIPFQLRSAMDPFIREYYYHISGDKFLFEHVPNSGMVLDVGTGAGRYPYLLRDRPLSIVGIDISDIGVKTARDVTGGDARFATADAMSLPFADGTFDNVIAVGLFNQISDMKPFFQEFKRVLKDDGQIVFNCNNKATIIPHKRQSYQAHYTTEEIRKLLSDAGLYPHSIETTFFTSLNQKKLIQSERVPIPVRWIGLWFSIFVNAIASSTPGLRSTCGHIWVSAKCKS